MIKVLFLSVTCILFIRDEKKNFFLRCSEDLLLQHKLNYGQQRIYFFMVLESLCWKAEAHSSCI